MVPLFDPVFEETLISQMLENENEHDPVDIDIRMAAFEQLMDRRPFMINDILLKQDPNNVSEWPRCKSRQYAAHCLSTV